MYSGLIKNWIHFVCIFWWMNSNRENVAFSYWVILLHSNIVSFSKIFFQTFLDVKPEIYLCVHLPCGVLVTFSFLCISNTAETFSAVLAAGRNQSLINSSKIAAVADPPTTPYLNEVPRRSCSDGQWKKPCLNLVRWFDFNKWGII